jgi:hypothetical protein
MTYKKFFALFFFLYVLFGSSATGAPIPTTLPTSNNPDPVSAKEIYVLTDSVIFGAKSDFYKKFSDWTITYDGRPGLTIRVGTKEMKKKFTTLPKIAVIGLGYNSLWEKDRKNYKSWSSRFDKEAEELITALEDRGVEKIIWVNLREATPDIVPKKALWQYEKYAWYFG